jgi:PAS domain S-box-containing protein
MPETLHALIVEDSEDDALLMVRQLRKGGYEPVYELVSTPEGMSAALDRPPWDIIIADYSMPHFSGVAALHLVKDRGLDLPFIIVSGVIGEETAVEAMKAGAHDYLMKGNLARLIPAIERELREARVRKEQRRAEEALRESERRFRLLVERAADALFLHDMDGRFMDVNKQACESLGYTRDELMAMSVWDVVQDYDMEGIRKLWEDAMTQGPITLYGTHRCKDGRMFPVEVRIGLFEANENRYILALARDITERKKAEAQIRESLHEKEVLLKEIHHRVKNNLQVIYSLLNLQSGSIRDPRDRDMIRECQNRIKSMAIIHETLYQSRDLARVNLANYIRSLADNLFRSYGVNGEAVRLDVRVSDVYLGFDTAIPCGLIINELISNSLKYAFPEGREGRISIDLHPEDHDRYALTVRDDGVGLPPDLDFRDTRTLGLQLVTTLTDQLEGAIVLHRERGTEFKITFGNPLSSERK